MLNLVKNFMAADTWRPSRKQPFIDRSYLARIHVGSVIGFGPMPQIALSEKRLEVTAVKTYYFTDYQYVAYELSSYDKKPIANLIIAEAGGEQYLALSRKVTEEEQPKLFQGQNIADFMKRPAHGELRCKHGVRGFRGWIDYVYHRALEGIEGAVHPGNLLGKPLPEESVEKFDYFLFVNADNEYAVEIEKYDSGQVDIYTTIYRPVSDIVSISIPRKPRLVAKHEPEETKFNAELKQAMEEPRLETVALSVPVVETVLELTKPVAEVITHNATVGCDIKVARRIIEEAVKNGITLSQLVRKVVGLPMEVKEEVFFSLPLSEGDYQALAARYKLPAHAHETIHARILEEVAGFAGVRS